MLDAMDILIWTFRWHEANICHLHPEDCCARNGPALRHDVTLRDSLDHPNQD